MSDDAKTLKMKNPEELLANPMDILKSNPFLLPAQLLALNPQLYAAQFAQLQAAQMLLAKQSLSSEEENGDSVASRKRGGDALETESKQKQSRSSSPKPGDFLHRPLDLSGSRSPDMKTQENFPPMMNPMMQAGLLNLFTQLRPPVSPPSPPGRAATSPWQAQWASRNSDSGTGPEDVFKCVWCKESYHSLDQLTKHMREAKHHNMPQYSLPGIRPGPPVSSPVRASMPMAAPTLPSPPRPERDVLRDQMPIPRKLVRGQDVWIGRADEQTRDILKCMGCGESFRTLDLLTKHMQATQHYKKVISHDQISTWKYPESPAAVSKSPVNSVLSCKVCDKGFSSLKDLSDHMVRNNHYAGAESKLPRAPPQPPSAQQSRDRKKSLPVKKLLELERARQEVAGNKSPVSAKEIMESGKLMCERCEEKIPIDIFIPHIQQCVGRPRFLKAPNMETGPSQSGNKESKVGSKSETKEGNSEGSSDSILGSLEQLVKGNFTATASSKILPPISSPAQSSPIAKFNITSLFPMASSASPPSSPGTSSHNSKPASPNNNNTNNILQTSLEKMLDSPIERLCSPHNGQDRQSQSPGTDKTGSSPRTDDEKHIPQVAGHTSPRDDGNSTEPVTKDAAHNASHNALAALQNFCNDQTKSSKPAVKETVVASSSSPMSDPGAILAFSWAVNQAGNSSDSAIKCPFCDTPFISKGAYRHHLSKIHFTKENIGNISTPNIPQVANLNSKSGVSSNRTPSPEAKDAEESLQSKYQKYSQLAKQLSCYDGTN